MRMPPMPLSTDLVHEVMIYAENELAALQNAVRERFGLEQAELATGDWLSELALMEWLPESSIPNWRQPTFFAMQRLAERIAGLSTTVTAPELA